MSMTASTLIVRGLQKSYGARQVVRDVSLQVESGEVVGLLGPNGAGKTTSFYMIVGLVPSDAGEIDLDGVDISQPADPPARDAGPVLSAAGSVGVSQADEWKTTSAPCWNCSG